MIKKIDPSSLMKSKELDKKSILYLIIVIVAFVFICIGFFYLISGIPETEEEKPAESKKEEIIKRQLKRLEKEIGPLSEEEIKKQLKGLEALR